MNLVIDIGNTRAKVYQITPQGEIHHCAVMTHALDGLTILATQCKAAIVSNVATQGVVLPCIAIPVLRLGPDTPLPIAVEYGTPQTLGTDRIAAAVGAHHLCPNRPSLVIDSGTCITIDLVLPDRGFVGGNISAGVAMRLQACHEHTGRLPLVQAPLDIEHTVSPSRTLGTTTIEALSNGALLGVRYEIEGYVRHFAKKYGNLAVIFTGGAAFHFDVPEKVPIFVRPNLVAEGLNAILEHNTTLL